ncbi:transcriptional regulator, BadM/Rrf2 family [Pustulibacterium marinum]|uniref:Transcriptional regulator, BadM/Rrf2 family n=1 Tax=Pustulibacterium marinum TaxID=1224947 RepID=A0A1I7F7Q6_9FLAO|nr:Rrf2 family transcriptional regulator [Pustulibacterium marinum]SFU32174.1 transcriptional regulator, BadM/Rrf2 family [Pustulibacterium marinum]
MLSKKTKYGLKALANLAKKGKGTPVLISKIAEEENISKKFLEAILLQLKNNGFLGSKMGKGGGYYLLKEPREVKLASMYRILEGPIALLPCVSLNYYEKCEDCKSEETCQLNRVMIEVRDKTLSVLENKTLEDLIK